MFFPRESRQGLRIHSAFSLVVGVLTLSVVHSQFARADERPPKGAAAGGFRALLEKNQRDALRQVGEYVAAHADADDVDQAAQWMFETALSQGLEAEVITQAEQYLKRRGLDQPSISLAQQAFCVGLARTGRRAEALLLFEAYLKGVRFQSPYRTLDLANSLAAQARVAGDVAGSREVYERVAATYPLNSQMTEIVAGRIARQELIGQPAPRLAATDIAGQPVAIGDFAGRVVLVDFWATTCAPCLAEFPNLKQIYKENHEKGFEIVGVSFDDGPETVQAYLSRAKLPWPMVMDESPEGVISRRFNTKTIPALFLVDRRGKVAQVDIRGNDLRAVVEKLLKE